MQMLRLLLLFGLPLVASAEDAETVASVRSELEAMLESDQANRREVIDVERRLGKGSAKAKDAWAKLGAIDARNIRRLDAIIARYGWPGSHQFGGEAAIGAFLVLQHADLVNQKKYLPLLRDAAARGDLPASSLALLEDRVRVREGRQQIFGSQVTRNGAGEWEPQPVEDEGTIDIVRASVGLGPISEYLEEFASRSGRRVSPRWKKNEPESARASPPGPVGSRSTHEPDRP